MSHVPAGAGSHSRFLGPGFGDLPLGTEGKKSELWPPAGLGSRRQARAGGLVYLLSLNPHSTLRPHVFSAPPVYRQGNQVKKLERSDSEPGLHVPVTNQLREPERAPGVKSSGARAGKQHRRSEVPVMSGGVVIVPAMTPGAVCPRWR